MSHNICIVITELFEYQKETKMHVVSTHWVVADPLVALLSVFFSISSLCVCIGFF